MIKKTWRKLSFSARRSSLLQIYNIDTCDAYHWPQQALLDANNMIEQAIGITMLPLGLVPHILVNNQQYSIPMATEESSVIAAANFACHLISNYGGFHATPAEPLLEACIYLPSLSTKKYTQLLNLKSTLTDYLYPYLTTMHNRGGGLHDINITRLADMSVRVTITLNVCNAMGANFGNHIAEKSGEFIAHTLNCIPIMHIISNQSSQRIAHASFSIPVRILAYKSFSGHDIAQRIITATRIAHLDPMRAITHNKGIMNGVIAFAIACGNDTRAIESAVHAYAAQSGTYMPLSRYHITTDSNNNLYLHGNITLPTPIGTIGGACAQKYASIAQNIIIARSQNNTKPLDSRLFSCLIASLGLAQNFAALKALVSSGIQQGHMPLHMRKTKITHE